MSTREEIVELKAGDVEAVLADLRSQRPRYEEGEKAVSDLMGYLEENRSRMRCVEYLTQGLMVGSGAIESGIKNVVNLRMKKGCGMRWALERAESMLTLRAAHLYSACGEQIVYLVLDYVPAASSPVDYVLELYSPDGVTLLNVKADANGADGTTELEAQAYLPGAGFYYLRVLDSDGYEADPAAPYTLALVGMSVPDGDAEPNGNVSDLAELQSLATPLQDGVPATGFIASEGDHDWFALEVAGESVLELSLTNAPASSTPVDLVLELYDTDAQTELAHEADANGESGGTTALQTLIYVPAAGTYYLQVRDSDDDEWDYDQPYTLTATARAVPDGDAEPNGNVSDPAERQSLATPLPAAAPASGYLVSLGDGDWFVFSAAATGALTVELTNAPATATPVDFVLEVYAADASTRLERTVDGDGTDGTTTLSLIVDVPAGDVYLLVSDSDNNEWDYDQPYQISARVGAP